MSDPWVRQIIPVAISVNRNDLSRQLLPASPRCCSHPQRDLAALQLVRFDPSSLVSETVKTASLAPRYRAWGLTVPNIKFCISLADSLRWNQINTSRIRPWNPGFSLCPLPSLLGYKGSSLFICFLILQICPHNWEDRVIKRSEKWLCGNPDAIPGVWVLPWQEWAQSKLIQPEEGSNLCLSLPGQLRWPPAFSITFSLKTRNEAVSCTQQKGDNLGAEVCFGGCISGSLRHPGREAAGLNLFQTRS